MKTTPTPTTTTTSPKMWGLFEDRSEGVVDLFDTEVEANVRAWQLNEIAKQSGASDHFWVHYMA